VTQPPPEPVQPATTVLDEARAQLFAALQRVWVALGWPEDRAEQYPPLTPRAPEAWVDVPVLHQAPTQQAQAVAATFPVVFLVDGSEEEQVKQQDKLLAYGWQELDRVKVRGYASTLQSAGPEELGPEGAQLRGLVFRVQVTVQTRTLCPQPLVQPTDEGTP
jgi:hypothetical protein